jgi:hypothetical protein
MAISMLVVTVVRIYFAFPIFLLAKVLFLFILGP